MIRIPKEPFYEVYESEESRRFLSTLVPLRGGLWFDRDLLSPWSCDPERCRPKLGPNLCCRVQVRCRDLVEGFCSIHDQKPFGCALFPADLLRIGSARAVVSVSHPILHREAWTRFDRDMLRCFEEAKGPGTVYSAVRDLLSRVFTRSEFALLEEAAGRLSPPAPATLL